MALSEFTIETSGETDARDRKAGRLPAGLKGDTDWYLRCLCLLALAVITAFFYAVSIRVAYPYQLDYGEGIVLWQAQHISHLSLAYASIDHFPYIVFHYTPLYHLVSLAVSKLTGDLLLAGRLVSAISCVGICATLVWVVYCVSPKRATRLAMSSGALPAGTSPLCLVALIYWTPFMRVDLLGLWFTLTGLSVFVLARTSFQRYLAFVLFLAAVYTRQSLIAGAVSCLAVASIVNRREAVKLFAFAVALGSAVMAILYFFTNGEIIKHLFLYNVNRFSIKTFISLSSYNLLSIAPILPLAFAAALGPFREVAKAFSIRNWAPLRARLVGSRYRLAVFTFAMYFAFSWLISLSAGKSGSSFNYFLEMDLGVCALASLFVARRICCRRPGPFKFDFANLVPMLFVAFPAVVVSAFLFYTCGARESRRVGAGNSATLVRMLTCSPDPVMSEDMTLLYKAGKQVPFEPAIVRELAAVHIWDETPLVNLINNRRFSVMIISSSADSIRFRYSPAVLNAILKNYRATGTYAEFDDGYTVYLPNGGSAGQTCPSK